MTAAIAQDRLLRDGYLPDDCELLLLEAEWCVCSMNGVGDFSSGMGARYQACINKFERLRLAAVALDATSRTTMIRRRRLLWRIAAGSPLRPALRLLGSLVTILCVRIARVIQTRLRGRNEITVAKMTAESPEWRGARSAHARRHVSDEQRSQSG